MKKIYINPKVPKWMDFKDLNDRSESHMNKWFNRAYIRTQEFTQDTYKEYCDRMSNSKDYKLETEQEFNTRREQSKKRWFSHWKTGIRYDVRMLDGGAWDRTTNKGSFDNKEDAIKHCEELMQQENQNIINYTIL